MQTKKQDYPYSLKSVAAADLFMCNYKLYFRLYPPEELLEHRGLHTTIILVFDASVASGNRVVRKIGIGNQVPLTVSGVPTTYKSLTLNKVADVNRRVEINIDLSPLVIPNADNWVVLELDPALLNVTNLGTIKLWKIDELYITAGIR